MILSQPDRCHSIMRHSIKFKEVSGSDRETSAEYSVVPDSLIKQINLREKAVES